ncbi:DnaJ family domain-containing protein [Marisediminicola senii]|uniref:DnaJ family domain-containing protein n=1 Tax=Marisediminicola senii TaxID=2711233 RepID=UPI0013EC3F94|nr:DUF1992 domain-containing protein [Marisediminicola senii]
MASRDAGRRGAGDDTPPDDPRLAAARYRSSETSSGADPDDDTDTAGQSTQEERAMFVEMAIRQAIRAGEFDNLPGAGKPLENLQRPHDPDWWIRQKVQREQITGLGPPALTLRTENAALDARLDAAASERAVRELLDDFNARVIHARRQLQGGPPVVTPTRDIEVELGRWHGRRAARARAAEEARTAAADAIAAMTWRERRRARRAGGPAAR